MPRAGFCNESKWLCKKATQGMNGKLGLGSTIVIVGLVVALVALPMVLFALPCDVQESWGVYIGYESCSERLPPPPTPPPAPLAPGR